MTNFSRTLSICMLMVFLFAACGPKSTAIPTVTPAVASEAAPTVVVPTPSSTAAPKKLTVCLPQEPSSLYLYASSSRATWSVLEAIYDGPFDSVKYTGQPVIMEKLPSVIGGDARWEKVTVEPGKLILDAGGKLSTMAAGISYLPAGCHTSDCLATWDGTTSLEMDQLTVDFKIKPGITWSDGQPVQAEDSVYSFQLAADPKTPVNRWLVDRTAIYHALDANTVQWKGIPGYHPQRLDTLFFTPLPKHVTGSLNAEQLLSDEKTNRSPLGWGPYTIGEWAAGQQIVMNKNAAYFRAAEGLPYYDQVIYRFIPPTPDGNMAVIETGECDMVDFNPALTGRLEQLQDLEKAGKVNVLSIQGPEFEQMIFGIKPAQYDDGYSAYGGERPDFFSDVSIRKAIAMCIDRVAITQDLLEGFSSVPASYLPADHPAFVAELATIPYDPEQGKALLEQAGWKDFDNAPETPRVAAGVKTVTDGTPFEVTYTTTSDKLREAYLQRVVANLKDCGIALKSSLVEPEVFYAAGPEGLLFGRKFDLAALTWKVGAYQSCSFYTSGQIPGEANKWQGVNLGGYENPTYDQVCNATAYSDGQNVDMEKQAQTIFADQLPALPLYYRIQVGLAKPGLCGFQPDSSSRSLLSVIENMTDKCD